MKNCKCGNPIKNFYAKQCQKCYFKTLKGNGNPMFGVHRFGDKNPNYKNGGKKRYCIDCGKEIYRSYSIRCGSCANSGKNNWNYKVEYSKRIQQGYKFIKFNSKWIQEHRHVVEQYIGRKLTRQEVIHHIDGNKRNNKLKNLYIFVKQGLHTGFENLLRYNILKRNALISNLKLFK